MPRARSTESGNRLSGTRYFWLQLVHLGAGIFGLWLAHQIAMSGEATRRSVTLWTAGLVAVSLAMVGRAVRIIVNSAFSDSHRVFHCRHLVACSLVLFAGAALVIGPLLVHEPFERLVAHGRITAGEVADIASLLAATMCTVGAVVTSLGAWDARHDERHWYRSVHGPRGM